MAWASPPPGPSEPELPGQAKGVQVGVVVLNTLIDACCRTGDLAKASCLLDDMAGGGRDGERRSNERKLGIVWGLGPREAEWLWVKMVKKQTRAV